MTLELHVLVAAAVLGLLHLVLVAQLSNRHRGYLRWAAGARDVTSAPLPPVTARLERAYRNYMETFPYFAGVTLVAHALDVHSGLTEWGALLYLGARILYVPLYASGIWLLRSLVWNVAFLGIALTITAIVRGS